MGKKNNPNRNDIVDETLEVVEEPVEETVEVVNEPEIKMVKVIAERLNVREQPNTNSRVVKIVSLGTLLTGVYEGEWFKLDNGEGYVMSNFIG